MIVHEPKLDKIRRQQPQFLAGVSYTEPIIAGEKSILHHTWSYIDKGR
jgi:hypothetical protein